MLHSSRRHDRRQCAKGVTTRYMMWLERSVMQRSACLLSQHTPATSSLSAGSISVGASSFGLLWSSASGFFSVVFHFRIFVELGFRRFLCGLPFSDFCGARLQAFSLWSSIFGFLWSSASGVFSVVFHFRTFVELGFRRFLRVLPFPPLLHRLMISSNEAKLSIKSHFTSVKINSRAVPFRYVANDMLH